MFFSQALDKLSAEARDLLYVRLNQMAAESAIHQQLVSNIYAESRLQEEDWHDLAFRILGAASPEGAEDSIREFCRARTQRGGLAEISKDSILARVVTLLQLCSHLVKLGYFVDCDDAKASIEPILGSPVDGLVDWEGRILGCYQFWSTFEVSGVRPFATAPPSLDEILCVLGLMQSGDGPYLVVEFKLPAVGEAHIPTFCDAYAGDFWSRYFRPAPPGAKWGRTMPTDACSDQKGRPEVVNKAITTDSLCFPLRYV
jgi:hypothetical protein